MPPDYVTKETCEAIHAGTCESIDKLTGEVKTLNDRLYKDNGHLSIQTRLDRQDRFISVAMWILGSIGTTIIVQFVLVVIAVAKYFVRAGIL